jgi:hypothetical protein
MSMGCTRRTRSAVGKLQGKSPKHILDDNIKTNITYNIKVVKM